MVKIELEPDFFACKKLDEEDENHERR